ncbi:hypothetical protein FB45DRAFT_931318 [Roridomyces roridus]|uniref:Uncharacterized protein n=1 Tax=Roridomyces roridus TaxID=1738132 RepID=A0AAD7BFS8_9AGAR|nr:hypothetical protein FB45DRAFT_931318 [Roridomyces roridus]
MPWKRCWSYYRRCAELDRALHPGTRLVVPCYIQSMHSLRLFSTRQASLPRPHGATLYSNVHPQRLHWRRDLRMPPFTPPSRPSASPPRLSPRHPRSPPITHLAVDSSRLASQLHTRASPSLRAASGNTAGCCSTYRRMGRLTHGVSTSGTCGDPPWHAWSWRALDCSHSEAEAGKLEEALRAYHPMHARCFSMYILGDRCTSVAMIATCLLLMLRFVLLSRRRLLQLGDRFDLRQEFPSFNARPCEDSARSTTWCPGWSSSM